MTTTTVRPAKAAAVTRTLTTAGMTKGEKHASGMVKGWYTFTRGVTSSDLVEYGRRRIQQGCYRDGTPRFTWQANNKPTGKVHVQWQLGDSQRNISRHDAAQQTATQMARAADILTAKGYQVQTKVHDVTGETSLVVWRADETGQVVTW